MLASKMQIAAKRWLDLVMLLPASLYLVADGGGETGRRRGRKRPLFANYLYSCFVPFRHSQRLVRYYDKVQAEVTSAGRHIIYVISVLNYLHRKYGGLTSASTATVGDVLSPSLGQFWRWAQRFPNCLSFFFLSFRFFFFGLLIFLGFLCHCCRFRLEISHLRLQSPPSDATNDMLKWPKRFILRILFRLFFSASPFCFFLFFHSYITFVCLAACFVSLFAAAAIAIFLISRFSSFRHLFQLFSGAFAGNWIIRLHASLALIPVRHVPGVGMRAQLKYLHNFWVLAFACRFSEKSSLHFFRSSTS